MSARRAMPIHKSSVFHESNPQDHYFGSLYECRGDLVKDGRSGCKRRARADAALAGEHDAGSTSSSFPSRSVAGGTVNESGAVESFSLGFVRNCAQTVRVMRKSLKTWWPGRELNPRRQPFQGCALPPELPGHFFPSTCQQTAGLLCPATARCLWEAANNPADSLSACGTQEL